MRAASSDVLLLEILLIPSRIVIFNGFPHRSPQFQQRPHFFFYLSLSHPRIIISQLFEELKEEKRRAPLKRSHCNIPINAFLLSSKETRDSFVRCLIWNVPISRRRNSFEKIWKETIFEKKFFEIQFSKKGNRISSNLSRWKSKRARSGVKWERVLQLIIVINAVPRSN